MGNKHSKKKKSATKQNKENSYLENTKVDEKKSEQIAVFDYLPYYTANEYRPVCQQLDYRKDSCIETDSELETEDKQEMGNNTTYYVRALYSMKALKKGDLSFLKNDMFRTENCNLEGWIEAVNLRTNEKGFIPGDYVRLVNDHPTSLDAYYPIDRLEAEKKLLLPGQVQGTYIIRPRKNFRGYALSVLGPQKSKTSPVKHYEIHSSFTEGKFYIEDQLKFSSMQDLIDHYSKAHSHLNWVLTVPCPRRYKPPLQFNDLEVDRRTIECGREIGRGNFGSVYKGKWYGQLEVAIKVLHTEENRDIFLQEAKLMHQLHHERLVKLIGVCTKPACEPVFIITEMMLKGNLLSFLQSIEGQALTIRDYISLMTQITSGMKYLQSKNFIHRDLRAANVLVDRDNSVKVADFGLARLLEKTIVYRSQSSFPIKWTAPEAVTPPHVFSIKSDVWSFGVLMYEIVNPSHTVYDRIPLNEIPQLVKDGYRMSNPVPGNSDITRLYECMLQCWADSPDDRPCFRRLHREFLHWKYAKAAL